MACAGKLGVRVEGGGEHQTVQAQNIHRERRVGMAENAYRHAYGGPSTYTKVWDADVDIKP